MQKAVIFDFDGVVIHSTEVQIYAFRKSYESYFGKDTDPPIDEFFSHSGNSLPNIFRLMGLPMELVPLYQKLSMEQMDKIRLTEGIFSLLVKLKQQGIKCGICTGKDRERTMELLIHHDLLPYFDAVVCSDDAAQPKPAPDSVLLALTALKAKPEEAVMIGDGVNDILSAKAARVASIAVTWGNQPRERLKQALPDLIVDSVRELSETVLKKPLIMEDLVIQEDVCNMRCKYCLTNSSVIEKQESCALHYGMDTRLKKNLDTVMDEMQRYYDTAILKISGGEILLVKNILAFIRKQSKQYQVIQILTNGLLITEEFLKELKELGNVCIQISLDHHTLEGNYYRTRNEKQLQLILHNMDKIVEYHIPLEINCVLTDKNTGSLLSFAEYLMKYKGSKVMLQPFPVRGKEKQSYYPLESQFKEVKRLLDHYEAYQAILAPRAYLEELLLFLTSDRRRVHCFIPQAATGLFDDGRRTPCPNYWFLNIENVLGHQHGAVLRAKPHRIYRILERYQQKLEVCQTCFTPWDLFNLYLNGRLSLEELTEVPLYSFEGIAGYLTSLKNSLNKMGVG